MSIIGLSLLSGCTERGRDNPFDSGGSNPSPLTLTIASNQNLVRLNWNWANEPISDYSGFRIYRSVDNVQNFSLYREIPRNQFSFVDSMAQKYRWYFYRVSVYGPSVESNSSQPEKIYLGQGNYWILSSYGFWVRKASYDLLRTERQYYTTYPPEEWAVSLTDSLINLGFIRYSRGISQINLTKGNEDFFYSDDLHSPVDVEYDSADNRIYVLDADAQEDDNIFVIRDKTLERKISLPPDNYLKLYLSTLNQSLAILAETKYLRLSLSSFAMTDSVLFPVAEVGQDMDASKDSVFVLTYSAQTNMSQIHKIPFNGNSTNSISSQGNFYRITTNAVRNQFYLAEDVPSSLDQVVKLSKDGSRLFQLSGFQYIGQIGLNPYDESIIVVDRLGDRLTLYDSEGNEVSRSQSNSFYDPIRIFVE